MSELLGSNPMASSARLVKADFNGALLKGTYPPAGQQTQPMPVTEARCASYLGVAGIVIQETTNAFRMVTPENKLKGMA